MRQNLQEELNRMKYLLNAERGKVISETEIKKTFISEQMRDEIETGTEEFQAFFIQPTDKTFSKIPVGVKDGLIYEVYGKIGNLKLGKQIGFKSLEELKSEKNKAIVTKGKRRKKITYIDLNNPGVSEVYKNGFDYYMKYLSKSNSIDRSTFTNPDGSLNKAKALLNVGGYTLQNYKRFDGVGFTIEYKEPYGDTPFLFGFLNQNDTRNDLTVKIQTIIEPPVTTNTTTIPIPVVPREVQLDLQNPFFYDCPGKAGCGTKGGSNAKPFRDESAEEKIIDFGKNLNEFYKDKEPIYVLGFASTDGASQHNLELSQNRANFVADLIKKQINKPNIKIIPMGMGETDRFQRGTTEADYLVNRKIIVTKDPDSLEPFVFKFKVN
jgi:hypothetical protein